jgi:hypothetical protein
MNQVNMFSLKGKDILLSSKKFFFWWEKTRRTMKADEPNYCHPPHPLRMLPRIVSEAVTQQRGLWDAQQKRELGGP